MTYQCTAETTGARNVKFGGQIPITMQVTTKEEFLELIPKGVKWGLKGQNVDSDALLSF